MGSGWNVSMRWWKVAALVGPVLIGCGGSEPSSDANGPATGTQTQAIWACDAKSTKVVCTAPVTAETPKDAFYVCQGSDRGSTCPDKDSLKGVPGIDQILADVQKATSFSSMPWACLLTGKHQLQCARDIAKLLGGGAGSSDGTSYGQPSVGNGTAESGGGSGQTTPPSYGGSSGGSNGGSNGGSSDGSYGGGAPSTQPPPPSSCANSAWEGYFQQLATFEYGKHGISIAFPRDIFDCSKSMTNLAVASANTKVTPGAPTCHDGEWDMRQQAWLDAVTAGCSQLNNQITVLCQEAANYAPSTGQCNMTGSW